MYIGQGSHCTQELSHRAGKGPMTHYDPEDMTWEMEDVMRET